MAEGSQDAPAEGEVGRCGPSSAIDPKHRVKRKMALVIGYIGTEYRGLTINYELESSSKKKSVEELLRAALVRAGIVSATNAERLEQKIGWSRSSRTDQGVHALRLVISAKLMVVLDDIDEHGHSPQLVADVNRELPEDIRCFGAAKVPNSFDAKHAASWREYEYLLPTRLARAAVDSDQPDVDADTLAKRLERVVQRFEGCHSFHNFTRLKASDLARRHPAPADARGRGRGQKRKVPSGGLDEAADDEGPGALGAGLLEEGDEDALQTEQPDTEAQDSAASQSRPVIPPWVDVFARDPSGAWRERSAEVMKHTLSTIHMCVVEPTLNGTLLRVRIRGQFFLYNQIRLIVGTAAAVCSGAMSEELLDMALALQVEMHMPLAPPTGLLLRTAGFSELDHRAGFCAMDDQQARDCMLPESGFVLLHEGSEESLACFVRKVEGEVERQWRESGEIDAWLAKLTGIRPPTDAVLAEMRERVRASEQREAEARASQVVADQRRREAVLLRGGSFVGLMPRRFAAELMVRFRLVPSWRVTNLQHALGERIRRWHTHPEERPTGISWPPETKELLDYVAEVSVDVLAHEA